MRPEPTLAEKIALTNCAEELEGFKDQLVKDGRMTLELSQSIAVRRAELLRTSMK